MLENLSIQQYRKVKICWCRQPAGKKQGGHVPRYSVVILVNLYEYGEFRRTYEVPGNNKEDAENRAWFEFDKEKTEESTNWTADVESITELP